MLPRILEPEVMDAPDEVRDYDAMDHAEVNRLFVDHFLAALELSPLRHAPADRTLEILDVGTGTALIPIELGRRSRDCRITAVDLAAEMLRLAERNIHAAGLEGRIVPAQIDAKRLPYADAHFDAVISNTIVHHIPQPESVLAEMLRVLRPGGCLFVRDLLRPADLEALERLVALHAGGENDRQRQLLRDSLHAALTLDEVRAMLKNRNLPDDWVMQTSDRHWTISGITTA